MGASQNELLVCCVHMFMVSRGAWGIERMEAEPLDRPQAAVTAADPSCTAPHSSRGAGSRRGMCQAPSSCCLPPAACCALSHSAIVFMSRPPPAAPLPSSLRAATARNDSAQYVKFCIVTVEEKAGRSVLGGGRERGRWGGGEGGPQPGTRHVHWLREAGAHGAAATATTASLEAFAHIGAGAQRQCKCTDPMQVLRTQCKCSEPMNPMQMNRSKASEVRTSNIWSCSEASRGVAHGESCGCQAGPETGRSSKAGQLAQPSPDGLFTLPADVV